MSLKNVTKEIFTRYGFTEEDIIVYTTFVRVPRATVSEVHLSLTEDNPTIDFPKVEQIAGMLVEKGFLKKIEGIIEEASKDSITIRLKDKKETIKYLNIKKAKQKIEI